MRAQAAELGWCQNNADLPINQTQMLRFLFQAEFTTLSQMNSDAGDGMGLYWVQTWIEEMGGRIDVVTQPHQFTRFIISIPKPSPGQVPFATNEQDTNVNLTEEDDGEDYMV